MTAPRHTNNTATPRRRHSNSSVVIQITTTPAMAALLDRLVETGFFGNSRAAAAERLLAEAIRGLLREGVIQKSRKAAETES